MLDQISSTKQKLDEAISQLCTISWMFTKDPSRDFTRKRKLSFCDVISALLCMEGGTLSSELFRHFGYGAQTASVSAFIQQRSKIHHSAFSTLFQFFVQNTDRALLYKGYRLLAADGSDIQIPTNPQHPTSYFPGANEQSPYNLLHINALYDLLQHTYLDVTADGHRASNEVQDLCKMVDRSAIPTALVIADRGYEAYNLMAHIQEKRWKFLIRIKDIHSAGGMTASFDLPSDGEFDVFIPLSLTYRATNSVKQLLKDKNHYKLLSPVANPFDFLPRKNRKHDPVLFYELPFRIVRFQITENAYETVVTNLDADNFPPLELKKLYAMRWGVETSFRALKHTVGLIHFHAKKVENIYQEIFARLIMYNFSVLITSHVRIPEANRKLPSKANFSVAVHICRQFLRGNISPPDVEANIRKNLSPSRTGRSSPRKRSIKKSVSFTYRVA